MESGKSKGRYNNEKPALVDIAAADKAIAAADKAQPDLADNKLAPLFALVALNIAQVQHQKYWLQLDLKSNQPHKK